MKSLCFLIALSLLLAFTMPGAARGESLQAFAHATYVEHTANDGDSFMVKFGGDVHMVRLYYVDCPETTAATDTDRRRALDQARYFGLEDAQRIQSFGRDARRRVGDLLRNRLFTVHTSFANALGRSNRSRIYGLVELPDGTFLNTVLIREGLARNKGVRRTLPDGTSPEEHQAALQDLELAAAIARRGVWSETQAEKLASMRKQQRDEERAVAQKFGVFGKLSTENPIDLNSASSEELQEIKGIGAALAARIIQHRPYKTVDDLLKVPGIGPETLKNAQPFVAVGGD